MSRVLTAPDTGMWLWFVTPDVTCHQGFLARSSCLVKKPWKPGSVQLGFLPAV